MRTTETNEKKSVADLDYDQEIVRHHLTEMIQKQENTE